jgi:hypothetical protein
MVVSVGRTVATDGFLGNVYRGLACSRVGNALLALGALLGCSHNDAVTSTADPGGPITWHQHIAPLIHENCSGCHSIGGIAPFNLDSYDAARSLIVSVVDAVESGIMPPFLAQETSDCQPRFKFKDDRRLSVEQKNQLREWRDTGTPLGDPQRAAPLGSPPHDDIDPDIVLTMPRVEVNGPEDLYTCVLLDPALSQDVYVEARSVIPQNQQIVHHAVSYVLKPLPHADGTPGTKAELVAEIVRQKGVGVGGRYPCYGDTGLKDIQPEQLDIWAPGSGVNRSPVGTGQFITKESLVLVTVHYHPSAIETQVDDGSKLVLSTMSNVPALLANPLLLGNIDPDNHAFDTKLLSSQLFLNPGETVPKFLVPAGSVGHIEEMSMTWQNLPPGLEFSVIGAGTHMHTHGRSMRVMLRHGDTGEEECLLETPRWDFNWQRAYMYDAPISALSTMGNGDTLTLRCSYDNTSNTDVPLGGASSDEMCLTGVGVVYPNFHALGIESTGF